MFELKGQNVPCLHGSCIKDRIYKYPVYTTGFEPGFTVKLQHYLSINIL